MGCGTGGTIGGSITGGTGKTGASGDFGIAVCSIFFSRSGTGSDFGVGTGSGGDSSLEPKCSGLIGGIGTWIVEGFPLIVPAFGLTSALGIGGVTLCFVAPFTSTVSGGEASLLGSLGIVGVMTL